MGRAAKYTDEDILDAALEILAEDGAHAASAAGIAKHLGAPSGSIYHRFTSRDLILATLWIRTVKRFQQGFLQAFAHDETARVASCAVRHILDWTAAHRQEAKVLTMYRREDLIALWPDELGDELARLNDGVKHAIVDFTLRHFGAVSAETTGRARFALIEIPYAAARQMIRQEKMPAWLPQSVVAASLAALEISDSR